ncbi:MAG: sensor domain-containing diguanylate cyclase [Parabacteroides sp.]|nr:sensor domain-containing diguanylate cyclase [Parabacteroides sp.]
MKKRYRLIFSIITAVVAIALTISATLTIDHVNKTAQRNCFQELERTSYNLAREIKTQMDSDSSMLTALSHSISHYDDLNSVECQNEMDAFMSQFQYASYMAILTPDGQMMKQDGTTTLSPLVYADEVQKGAYISQKCSDFFDDTDSIVYNCTPIKRGNEPMGMLYMVVSLESFPKMYSTDVYDGKTYVYVIDGTSGDFLMDTWHKSLGNISEMTGRELLPGYSVSEASDDVKNGRSGKFGFVSKTTGQVLYMLYAPIGINNWSVMLTVDQESAMELSNDISESLYRLAFIVGAVLLAYMITVTAMIYYLYRKTYRQGREDQITGLLNRNAFERYITANRDTTFEELTCIYMDVNWLHEINNLYGHDAGDQMLRTLARLILAEFPASAVYRAGGDEFVVIYDGKEHDKCPQKTMQIQEQMEELEYSVSAGLVYRRNESGLSRIIKEADEKMLENKKIYYKAHDRRRSRHDN